MNNTPFYSETLDFRPIPYKRFPPKKASFHPSANTVLKIVPIEEHFENFVDVVNDTAVENFKFLKKLIAKRSEIKNKKKLAKADKIQAEADAKRISANADAQARIIEANAAVQQAATTNQLQQQIMPQAPPVQPQQTPMYQTLDMPQANSGKWEDIPADNLLKEPLQPLPGQPEQPGKPKANNKNKYILFAVIIIIVIGVVMYMRKKK